MQSSSIQFTTEHSVNNSINFLDLTISIVNNRIEYRNYIKDRKVNMMLHYKASFKAKPDSSNLKAFAF
jgi:hypothetical protein